MRKFLKSVVPESVLRKLRARLVQRNRRDIARAKRRGGLLLEPVNNVEHYFHFLLDLCLPLHSALQASGDDARFALREIGVFTERLPMLFPGRVEILGRNDDANGWIRRPLVGMNPIFTPIDPPELESFSRHVLNTLNIETAGPPTKILLIERLPPEGYFVTQATKKGGGASRRSIPNHQEFAAALADFVQAPFQFQNVQMEQLSFSEQVQLFHEAALVIGQHGAGLANSIWMQPDTTVIELGNIPKLVHFRILCRVGGQGYHIYPTAGAHTAIDIDDFTSWLSHHDDLRPMLSPR